MSRGTCNARLFYSVLVIYDIVYRCYYAIAGDCRESSDISVKTIELVLSKMLKENKIKRLEEINIYERIFFG